MEQWKFIPGFEGTYQVSDSGQVRSLDRVVIHKNGRQCKTKGKMLTPKPNVGGYPSLRLGREHPVMVHQIMAAAFLGPAEGRYVCHNDGVKSNNVLTNLRYDTPKSNQADRLQHGTARIGQDSALAKLTHAQASEVKRRAVTETYSSLAREFGVSPAAIRLIAIGVNWRRALGGT